MINNSRSGKSDLEMEVSNVENFKTYETKVLRG